MKLRSTVRAVSGTADSKLSSDMEHGLRIMNDEARAKAGPKQHSTHLHKERHNVRYMWCFNPNDREA